MSFSDFVRSARAEDRFGTIDKSFREDSDSFSDVLVLWLALCFYQIFVCEKCTMIYWGRNVLKSDFNIFPYSRPTMWYWKCIFLCAPSTSCETCKEMLIQSMNNHEMKHPISIPLISNSSPRYVAGISNQAAGFLFQHFIALFLFDLHWIFSRQYVVKFLQGKSLSRSLQPAALLALAKDPQIHPPVFQKNNFLIVTVN